MKPHVKAALVHDYDGDTCLACKGVNTRVPSTYDHGGTSLKDDYCGHCGVNWGVKTERIWRDSQPVTARHRGPQGHGGFAHAMPRSLDLFLKNPDTFGIIGRKGPQPYASVEQRRDVKEAEKVWGKL